MGKVIVPALIENLGDVENRERGFITADQVRVLEVKGCPGRSGGFRSSDAHQPDCPAWFASLPDEAIAGDWRNRGDGSL